MISWKFGWEKWIRLIFYLMELFQSLQPFIGILIGTLLLNAINHYYVKDSKKMLKYTLLVMLPFLAIGVLGMEFGCIPTEL